MRSINKRLRNARVKKGFKSAAKFARSVGIEETTYRHHENGTRCIDALTLARYANELTVDLSWLITGVPSSTFSNEESKLIEMYRNMSEEEKAMCLQLLLDKNIKSDGASDSNQ